MSGSRRPFDGKAVAVTGASSGLGAAVAEAFAAAGARPALFARSKERLEAVAARCRAAGGDPLVVAGDVTAPASCRALIERTVERFDSLDMLVASAGLSMWSRFDELDDADVLRRVMEVNYWGLVHCALPALPHLKQSAGMLVAVSSLQGKVGVPYHSGYAAAKHAVQGFCDSLRLELRGTGVGVLTVLPHWIQGTGLRRRALGADGRPRGEAAPRHGTGAVPVEAVARAVVAATRRRRRSLLLPPRLRLLPLFREAFPGLADRLIARRVEREAQNSRR